MWVFTEIGFFSAVASPDNGATKVAVRARVKQDAERLVALLVELGHAAPDVLQLKGRDYPYRVIIEREMWAHVMDELSTRIDYGNFKSHVSKVDGYERSSLYSRVWDAMLSAERDLGHKQANKSAFEPAARKGKGRYESAVEDIFATPFDVPSGSFADEPPTKTHPKGKKK